MLPRQLATAAQVGSRRTITTLPALALAASAAAATLGSACRPI